MRNTLFIHFLVLLLTAGCGSGSSKDGAIKILNVSYDPTREFYQEYNREFVQYWSDTHGQKVEILMSHGGSGSQARAVIEGLNADVVTLALAQDVNALYEQSDLLSPDWQSELPNNSAPYTSTIVFLVRKGNPKNIKDWDDLIRDDVQVITPNPKTSGAARWNYLAMWGYALQHKLGNLDKLSDTAYQAEINAAESYAKEFITQIFRNVPVLDQAARAATNTFAQRGIGDVLINWENEIILAHKRFGTEEFDIVIPSISILAEPTVALVKKNVDQNGSENVAKAYLEYLYSDVGQKLAAKHYYRPRSQAVLNMYAETFVPIRLFTIDEVFGGWTSANNIHFSQGGVFDTIYR